MSVRIDDSTVARLLAAARSVSANSYSPYSGFAVGAAVLSTDGDIFTGTNVENSSYGLTICAERAAIARLVADGFAAHAPAHAITAIAVVSLNLNPCYPCGACLQVIAEFASPDCEIVLADADGNPVRHLLKDLLPKAFEL